MNSTRPLLFCAVFLTAAGSLLKAPAAVLPAGNWQFRFNGVGSKDDEGYWLGRDRMGNLYAVGASADPGQGLFTRAVILKYDSAGREVWAVKRDAFLPLYGAPAAIDPDGNLYLAGNVRRGSYQGAEDLLLKYDPDGRLLWETRYSDPDPACSLRYPCARMAGLALDPEGNACVTGTWQVSAERWHSLTIRYDRDGRPIWTLRLDDFSPGAIAADALGFVVSGAFPSSPLGGVSPSLLLARYSRAGTEVWKRVAPPEFEVHAHGLTVDGQGTARAVAIAARTAGERRELGLLILGYTSTGIEIANRFNPQPQLDDTLSPIASDQEGNLFACASGRLFKLASDGRELWSIGLEGLLKSGFYPGGLAVDGRGHLFVSASLVWPANRSLVLSFDPRGNLLWPFPVEGAGMARSLAGRGLLTDGSGGVLMVGAAYSSGTGADLLVRRVGPEGADLWSALHDEPGDALDWFGSGGFGLDGAGHSYLAGLSSKSPSADAMSIVLLKVDLEGKLAWTASHPIPPLNVYTSRMPLLAVDKTGNSLLAAHSFSAEGVPECLVLRYGPDGALLWERRFHGEGRDSGLRPFAVARDGAGNLVVGVVLLKYLQYWSVSGIRILVIDPAGSLVWSADEPGVLQAMAVDGEGNVHLAGSSSEFSGQFLTVKLDRAGRKVWSATFDAPAGGVGAANAIAVDASGDVLVAGFLNFWDQQNALTVRYAADGSLRWARFHDSGSNDSATSLVLGPEGEAYVVGETGWSVGQFVVKYDAAGREQWSREVRGSAAAAPVLDRNRRLYLTGATWTMEDWISWTTVLDSGGEVVSSINSPGRWTLGAALDGESSLRLASLVNTSHFLVEDSLNDFEISRYAGLPAPPGFIRGDCDRNGRLSITDPVVILGYLFLGGVAPECLDACDADGDASPWLFGDAIYLLQHSFLGGPPPPAPFPACGIDPVGVGVGCATPEC